MKRTSLSPILITALLFSAMARALPSLLVTANFVAPPIDPVITIESPSNRTYNTTTIPLKVTFETYKTGYPGGPESDATRLFTCSIDGNKPQPISITNSSVAINPGGDVFFEGSADLTELTEGPHNLTVRVEFVYDNPSEEGYIVGGIHTESELTVYFRIETAPPFPAVPIAAASVAAVVICVGLLLYRRKRRKEATQE